MKKPVRDISRTIAGWDYDVDKDVWYSPDGLFVAIVADDCATWEVWSLAAPWDLTGSRRIKSDHRTLSAIQADYAAGLLTGGPA